MADTRGIRAGRAYVELGVSDKLTAGLRRAQRQLRAFGEGLHAIGTRLTAVAAAALAPLGAAVKHFSSAGDDLHKMAARTGVSAEALSELGFAAEQSGADLESLELGLRRMQKVIGEAAEGSASARDALGALGLTLANLQGLAPDRQFALIAERIRRIPDPALRAAAAMEIFGRSGTRLLPLMQNGAKGIEDLREQARALGLTVSTETAEDAALLNDTLNILWRVLKQGVFVVGSALAPAVIELSNAVTRTVVSVTDWIRQNKAAVVTAAKVAAGVAAAGAAIIGLGGAASALAAALGGIAAVTGGVVAVLSKIGVLFASLLSPIGLATVAVAALGGTLLYVSGAGGAALDWLGDQFRTLQDTVKKVVDGIVSALAAGDIGLAARILWLSLKLVWQEGVTALQRVWAEGQRFFTQRFYDMWFGAQMIAAEAWHYLKVGWVKLTAFLSDTWTRFSSRLAVEWATVVNLATKAWNQIKSLFDEGLDVEAANLAADQALVAAEQKINAQKDAALAAIANERQQDLAAEQSRYEARQREIVGKDAAASRALDAETNARLARTQADLEQARKELDAALAQARQKRDEAGTDVAPKRGAPAGLQDRFEGLADLLAAKASVIGTFNVASTLGLQAGGAQDRIADATERTAQGVEQLRKDLRDHPMAFAS